MVTVWWNAITNASRPQRLPRAFKLDRALRQRLWIYDDRCVGAGTYTAPWREIGAVEGDR
jgi:hypothetical protein